MRSSLKDLSIFLAFDYSQAEIRMLAEVSNDELLIAQLCSGQDIHCLIGNALTGWPVERISKEKNLRKMVKNTVFGVIFGLGRDNLYPYVVGKIRAIDGEKADLTGITPERLGKLYDKFFQRYKGVARYVKSIREQAEKTGYVETLFGFRREIHKNDESRTTYWANQAVNSPIQGSAHQFMLIAMALLHLKPKTYNLLQSPIMEVHDALYFICQLGTLPDAYRQGDTLLRRGTVEYAARQFKVKLRVPMLAEGSAGFCMGSMIGYEGEPLEEFLPKWRVKQREIESKNWEDLLPAGVTV